MTIADNSSFHYITDTSNPFLSLFPHRFDYIYAPHPNPGDSPTWQTESRHPLSDRLIQQGGFLYGVRFGTQTQYCLLDIDRDSPYHPGNDPQAIARITTLLEPLGLVNHLTCTSSYSGGLHLYFPFQQSQSSWELAIAIATLLENAGFNLTAGQLELFPNPKPYIIEGNPSLFNAHRLPMQAGSYLLDSDFQPIYSDQDIFVEHWHFAIARNDLQTITLKRIIRQAKRKRYRISGKADKFLNDLNIEVEMGWTDHGQTNRLLGRITMREYIFHHVIHGGNPLTGDRLVKRIVEVAENLPGYHDWCSHQQEIAQRAEEWVRCIENSHYFYYGDTKGKYKSKDQPTETALEPAIQGLPSYKQQQSQAARDKIRQAIAQLLDEQSLPSNATARYQLLTETFSIGGGTLYRHKDLWHPLFLNDAPVENPPDPPTAYEDSQLDCAEGASNWHNPTSLLSLDARNDWSDAGLGDRTTDISEDSPGNAAEAVDLEATQQAPEGSVTGEAGVPGQSIPVLDFLGWQQTLGSL
ncbi:MAG: hypothetical protein MUF49_25375 [Oculatellaceae cyanobacterium Prado106]|jgi:hypothetical protein|nr:hypothetical protein [Oculatellaceae cyanobacterium Prado106]